MKRFLVASLLFAGVLSSCAPAPTTNRATITPIIYKLSEPVPRGGALTIQGRYLGGPSVGKIRFATDENGKGGFLFPASAVQKWTDDTIVVTVPMNAPIGGGFVVVEVDGMQSIPMPYSVSQ